MDKEYALLPLEEYNELKEKANTTPTYVFYTDIIFLARVVDELYARNFEGVGLIIGNNEVSITGYEPLNKITLFKTFPISECEDYYIRVSTFISEVLEI